MRTAVEPRRVPPTQLTNRYFQCTIMRTRTLGSAPGYSKCQITGSQLCKHRLKTQNLKFSRRARLPRRAAGTGLQHGTMPGEYAQPSNFNRREGARLLPAAGTNKLQKIQCKYGKSCGFSGKWCRFASFYRRKEQAPSLRSVLADCTDSPNIIHCYRLILAARQGCRALREDCRFYVFNWCLGNLEL